MAYCQAEAYIPHSTVCGDLDVTCQGLVTANLSLARNEFLPKPFSDQELSSFIYWLVVSTILKHISQWEGLSHILWKIKIMFETTNQYMIRYSKP